MSVFEDARANPIGFVARWAPLVLGSVAIFLVPWTLWLTYTLPTRHVAHHWRIAWVGFDVALAVVLAVTALGIVKRKPWIESTAMIAGTLLLADAWFDVLTSKPGDDFTFAAAEAAFAEVPLALLCFWLGLSCERFYARTDRFRSRR